MKTTNNELNKTDLQNIVRGAIVLGSGGGGGYAVGMKLTDHFEEGGYYHRNMVRVESVDNVCDKKRGVVVAYIGAPQKAAKLRYPASVVAAVERLQTLTDDRGERIGKIDYIIPVEIGAVSSVVACLTAAKLDIPVLDLDLAGRAVPTLELIMFSTQHVSVNPTILAAEKYKSDGTQDEYATEHYCVELRISDGDKSSAATKIESLARPILSMPEYAQTAGLAMWVVDDVRVLKDSYRCIQNTLTLCRDLGKAIQLEQQKERMNIDGLLDFFNRRNTNDYHAYLLCTGTVTEATTVTSGGFDVGVVTVENTGSNMKLLFQNETLLVWDSAQSMPCAMAPDLISYIIEDDEKTLVFSNDDIMKEGKLKENLRSKTIHVVALRAPYRLRRQNDTLEKSRQLQLNAFADMLSEVNKESEVCLLQNYASALHRLGYYGKYMPIEELIHC